MNTSPSENQDVSERIMKGYTLESIKDTKNVTFLNNIFAEHGLKPFLIYDDKIPFIDGHVDILEGENNTPTISILVQVRPLALSDIDNPKAKIELDLFTYAKNRVEPIVFIIVNRNMELAFWKYIDPKEIEGIPNSQKEKTFYFNKSDIISKINAEYIPIWKKVYFDRRIKILENEELHGEIEKQKNLINEIQSKAMEDQSTEYLFIHEFLDAFNDLYSRSFNDIKNFIYPNTWKFGLAYSHYDDSHLSFTCFPIYYDNNSKQIIRIDTGQINSFLGRGLTFHSGPNLIAGKKYFELSNNLVNNDIEKIVKNQWFNILDKFQTEEILFYFIQEMGVCLGLEDKEEFSFSEIYDGWVGYFPVWLDEASKIPNIIYKNPKGEVMPSFIKSQLDTEQLESLNRRVADRLSKEDYKTPPMVITHHSLKLLLVVNAIGFLADKNLEGLDEFNIIKRPYPLLNSITEKKSYFVWERYSPELMKEKYLIIYKNFLKLYDLLIKKYFSQLYEELKFFKDFDKIIVHIDFNNSHSNGEPRCQTCYLKSTVKEIQKPIEIYINDEYPYSNLELSNNVGKYVSFEDGQYKIISYSWAGCELAYPNMPVQNLLYKVLGERLKNYFSKLRA